MFAEDKYPVSLGGVGKWDSLSTGEMEVGFVNISDESNDVLVCVWLLVASMYSLPGLLLILVDLCWSL